MHFYSDDVIYLIFSRYAYLSPGENARLAQYNSIAEGRWLVIPEDMKKAWVKLKPKVFFQLYNVLLIPRYLLSTISYDMTSNGKWCEVEKDTKLPLPDYITVYGKTFLADIITFYTRQELPSGIVVSGKKSVLGGGRMGVTLNFRFLTAVQKLLYFHL